ncbi:MAG: VPLPA-CTERM sorting domain-containing protein [Thiohalocapsa sp. PB-PSB1]|jgi:hypothetical protein|nr:MAG: VPLPA-CTERM sorting domain-containing protein [Thiohalocapsa sp. PB-PSB1]
MTKPILPVAALPLALAVSMPASAALSLQALFDGDSLTVENALFDNWTLNSLTVTDPGQSVDLDQIIVSEVFGDPLRPGLSFDGGGQLRVSNIDFQFIDLDFSFTVQAINGADPFNYNGLIIDGYDLVSGDGGVQLEETVRASSGGTQLAFKETFVDTFLGDEQLNASAFFSPHSLLFVTKDVYVFNDIFIGGEFELDGFGQMFSSVPVPATPLMIFAGLGALAAVRRTRKPGPSKTRP